MTRDQSETSFFLYVAHQLNQHTFATTRLRQHVCDNTFAQVALVLKIAMTALASYAPITARASFFSGRKIASRVTNGTGTVSMRATWMPGSAPPSHLDGSMPW